MIRKAISMTFISALAVLMSWVPSPQGKTECYTCKKAHVGPMPAFANSCAFTCKVQACVQAQKCSSVVAGACDQNVKDKDCDFTGVPNFVGVSQCNDCVVDASITCPPGENACKVNSQNNNVSVPDCKTVNRTVDCVKRQECLDEESEENCPWEPVEPI